MVYNNLQLNKPHKLALKIKTAVFSLLFFIFFSHGQAEVIPTSSNDSASKVSETTLEPAVVSSSTGSSSLSSVSLERGTYTLKEYRKGSRLFMGLVPFESGTHNCASCHYLQPQQTINWNPSAFDLAVHVFRNDQYKLKDVMNIPASPRMMQDHKGMFITDQEARYLEAFLYRVKTEGPGELKAYPIRAAIFWGLGILMFLALVDLLFTKKIKYRVVHGIILLIGLTVHANYAYTEARNLGRTKGYAPDQPIKFSHKIHAGENKTDCRYCHHIADFSKSAGFPSVNVCLNCHKVVRNGTNSGRFEINKIHYSAEHNLPIEWIKIHNLPDHSFFSHAQHVNAGRLDCTECHGKVEEMHIVMQVEDLSMGWCLTCHRTRKVDFLDNPYYQVFKTIHEDVKRGKLDSVTVARVGGENCMKCHY